jgi:hypothetical protein
MRESRIGQCEAAAGKRRGRANRAAQRAMD